MERRQIDEITGVRHDRPDTSFLNSFPKQGNLIC